jgi:hypothetical protein
MRRRSALSGYLKRCVPFVCACSFEPSLPRSWPSPLEQLTPHLNRHIHITHLPRSAPLKALPSTIITSILLSHTTITRATTSNLLSRKKCVWHDELSSCSPFAGRQCTDVYDSNIQIASLMPGLCTISFNNQAFTHTHLTHTNTLPCTHHGSPLANAVCVRPSLSGRTPLCMRVNRSARLFTFIVYGLLLQ